MPGADFLIPVYPSLLIGSAQMLKSSSFDNNTLKWFYSNRLVNLLDNVFQHTSDVLLESRSRNHDEVTAKWCHVKCFVDFVDPVILIK